MHTSGVQEREAPPRRHEEIGKCVEPLPECLRLVSFDLEGFGPADILLVVLSIQPKHMASSTASMYQKVRLSTGRPRFTFTQHSFSRSWFRISHSRNCSLDVMSSKLWIVIFPVYSRHLTVTGPMSPAG